MLLAIDVGNSNLSAGVFQGETLLMKGKISVRTSRSADEYAATLYDLMRMNRISREQIGGCILASVVPELTGLAEEAARLVTLVDDIIHLSQLDEGVAPEREEVDLLEIAGDAAASLRAQAEEKGVRLSVTGEKAQVNGVRSFLHEMIYNLCDNAIKYNRPGGSRSRAVQMVRLPHRHSRASQGSGWQCSAPVPSTQATSASACWQRLPKPVFSISAESRVSPPDSLFAARRRQNRQPICAPI